MLLYQPNPGERHFVLRGYRGFYPDYQAWQAIVCK